MEINTPGNDTPGIYQDDLKALEWAAKFASSDESAVVELLGDHAARVPAEHRYPALAGLARCRTFELLLVVNRLAEQARKDAETIAQLRAELATAHATCLAHAAGAR